MLAKGAVSWAVCCSAQHCCLTLPAHSCHTVCICVLYLPYVWVPTARPSSTANHFCFAEIHQPRRYSSSPRRRPLDHWEEELSLFPISLSVSWLVRSDLTPDLVSKCRWSTNNSVAGLVTSSSLKDAQKSFRLCPLVLKQICAKQGSPWDNSTVAATVLMYSAAIEPQSLQPHHHTKNQSHTVSVPPWE